MHPLSNRRLKKWATAAVFAVALPLAALIPGPAASSGDAVSEAPTEVVHLHTVRVNRSVALVAAAPKTVTVGTRFLVKGNVKVAKKKKSKKRKRVVVLREKRGTKWVAVAKKKTNKKGAYTFRVAAGATTTTRVLQVKAKKVSKALPAVSKRVKVKVVAKPKPDPAPAPPTPTDPPTEPPADPPVEEPVDPTINDWQWLFDGGSRWNPCRNIPWNYSKVGEPYPGALADVQRAFDRVAAETGLNFVYRTNNLVDIRVGWNNAANDPYLDGSVVGYAETRAARVSLDVRYEITSSKIVLDNEARLRSGHHTEGDPSWGQVMTHEVTHATGLDHASHMSQVMYQSVTPFNHVFGNGDLSGLAEVGTKRGCM